MEVEYKNEIFSFANDKEMEDVKEEIMRRYREERGSLEHSCEGTSEAQSAQFKEAITRLDDDFQSALSGMGCG